MIFHLKKGLSQTYYLGTNVVVSDVDVKRLSFVILWVFLG